MDRHDVEVVIVGAGPYGLALATQLAYRGVSYVICGHPMKFWLNMPPTLNLKSLAFATSIYVPEQGHTFPEWCLSHGLEDFEPCPMETFAQYGLCIQKKLVPDLVAEDVVRIEKPETGFIIHTSNGRRLTTRRVVVSTGLSHLAHSPAVLGPLPDERVNHTADLKTYTQFRGMNVAVVGAGASAIEAAALVHEAGGKAKVLARSDKVIFHTRTPRHRPLLDRILEPMTVLGAGRKHVVLEKMPLIVRWLPEERRASFVERYAGPSAPWWITDRIVGKVAIETSSEIEHARMVGDCVRVKVRSHSGTREMDFDHVIAGTGYSFDVSRLPFLDDNILASIRMIRRAPALSTRFESSVDGLHFVGPMSAVSFGPLYRFVCGADYTVKALAHYFDRKCGVRS